MDQHRWKTVNDLFHAALEVSASERDAFVSKASAGDEALEQEVKLLLKADQDAGSYIEVPLVDSNAFRNALRSWFPEFVPGDILCGRFKIVRAVGEGGMGYVFEALDTELGVHVALKTIRPEIAANPEALARFRQEVRLARRITHPNVCRTFDLERETRVLDAARGTQQEILFLTMEFLEGETLAARIRREGALPLKDALVIARQVAGALDAARALGVVHRDIKPGNIMLTPKDEHGFRAVVTDFGLARLDGVRTAGGSTFGNSINPIGTLAYMAPEQLEGDPVSSAADVYAFGLVLFEMVTGQRAFPSDTLRNGITQRLSGTIPKPEALVPDLPAYWSQAIQGCLRVKPEERFAAAGNVVAILENNVTIPVLTAPNQPWRALMKPRRLTAAGLTFCAAVSLFWAGSRYPWLRADSKVAAGALVYLAPIRNETGVKGIENVQELIQAGLAQSVQINLLDQNRVGDTLVRMTKPPDAMIDASTAREIAMRNGAVRVVFVTIRRSANGYELDLDVQQPDSTPSRFRDHWEKAFEWRDAAWRRANGAIPSELLTAIRNASDWIRFEVGESKSDIAMLNAPPEDVTTGSWEALEEYSQALTLAGQGQQERAVQVLEDAVRIDPGFSTGFGKLGDLLMSLGRTEESWNAYLKALDTVNLTRLTRRERDRIKGIYASDTEDFEAAEIAFRDLCTYYEDDYLGWFYRARPLMMLGRTGESVAVLRKAVALAPGSLSAKANLADHLILDEKYDEARMWVAKLKDEGHRVQAERRLADLAFLDQHYEEAEKEYQSLSNWPDSQYQEVSMGMLARVAAERGDAARAIQILDRALEYDRAQGNHEEQGSKLLDRAYLEAVAGQVGTATRDIESAIGSHSAPTSFIRASAILGIAYQRAPLASRNQIQQELVRLKSQSAGPDFGPITQISRFRLNGEIELARGNQARAVTEFLKADALQPPAEEREYLGRAYIALARRQSNDKHRSEYLCKARDAYGGFVSRPQFAWLETLRYPPGFFADQLREYLRLCNATSLLNSASRDLTQRYAGLRPHDAALSADNRNVPSPSAVLPTNVPTEGKQ